MPEFHPMSRRRQPLPRPRTRKEDHRTDMARPGVLSRHRRHPHRRCRKV